MLFVGLRRCLEDCLARQRSWPGTVVALGGAMLMTLVKGPTLNLPWTNGNGHHESTDAANKQDPIKGAVMILAQLVCFHHSSSKCSINPHSIFLYM